MNFDAFVDGAMDDMGAGIATVCLGCEHCGCSKHPPRSEIVSLHPSVATCMFCELATLRERCVHLETMIRREIPADPIHGADGRCICSGEGWCLFCRWAEESERADGAWSDALTMASRLFPCAPGCGPTHDEWMMCACGATNARVRILGLKRPA